MSEADDTQGSASRHGPRLAYTNRLAELIVHLTGCAPERALDAIAAENVVDPVDPDEALEIVARAMVAVRQLDLRDRLDLRERPALVDPDSGLPARLL